MNSEDRYHTTSWDGRQVQRQAASGDAGKGQSRPAPSKKSGGKKKPKRRMNPFLAVILWVVIVVASSAILACSGVVTSIMTPPLSIWASSLFSSYLLFSMVHSPICPVGLI